MVHRFLWLLLAVLASCGRSGDEPGRRPNVLLISLDSVRADLLSCYGHVPSLAPDQRTTPNLDRLAEEGTRFERAYSSSSWTLPSHMALITGQPDMVHGVEMDGMELSPERPTLARILSEAGYHTAGFYSGPYLDPRYGFGRGFDRYEAAYGEELRGAAEEERELREELEDAARGEDTAGVLARYNRARERLAQASHRDVSSEHVTDGLLDALEEAPEDRPWFLFGHYFDPHYDYVPPVEQQDRFDPGYAGDLDRPRLLADRRISLPRPHPEDPYRRRRTASDRDWAHVLALYAAEMAWTDAQIGRVLDALERRGELDETLVIVTADHGEEFFEHGHLGHRIDVHEVSMRVPLLVRYPDRVPAGRVVPEPTPAYDVFATVLDTASLEPPGGTVSTSLLDRIAGAEALGPLVRLVRVHDERGPEGAPLRNTRVLEAYLEGEIKVLRVRGWSLPARPLPEDRAREVASKAREDRSRDLSLRWIDLEQHPGEDPDAWSADFDDPRARRALERFRSAYPRLLRLRREPGRASSDAGQEARLEGLGYTGAVQDAGGPDDTTEYVLEPPGE